MDNTKEYKRPTRTSPQLKQRTVGAPGAPWAAARCSSGADLIAVVVVVVVVVVDLFVIVVAVVLSADSGETGDCGGCGGRVSISRNSCSASSQRPTIAHARSAPLNVAVVASGAAVAAAPPPPPPPPPPLAVPLDAVAAGRRRTAWSRRASRHSPAAAHACSASV